MERLDLEIYTHDGPGFQPLVFFGGWRVAILNHQLGQERGRVPFLERHHETDEVFVLLRGPATLLIAGRGDVPGPIREAPMEPEKLYNVPRDVWHAVITEPGSKLLIAENAVTDESNSAYFHLGPEKME